MVGAAGPPVMLDSGVAVATTGKVVRLRGRGARDDTRRSRRARPADRCARAAPRPLAGRGGVRRGSRRRASAAPSRRRSRSCTCASRPRAGVDLVLVHDETSGLWRWELPQQDAVRSPYAAAPSHFEVAFDGPPPPTGRRGLVGRVAGRIARFVVVRVTDELIAKGAQRIAELFEQRNRKGGLRSFTSADYQVAKPDEADQLRGPDLERLGAGPSLLFLHGTMALAHTGFKRVPSPLLERCARAYEDRVWAYDHHTLSKTPAQNTTDLVGRLRQLNSPHLVVDVIAHSRGGLVARELAELQARGSLIEVRSVLFVATPNGGTPLCDPEHLQRLVDRYTNLFALVPDNPVTDIIDALSSVAAAVALRAAGGLVGLAAMDPNGPYQKELAGRRRATGRDVPRHRFGFRSDRRYGTRRRGCAISPTTASSTASPNDLIVPTESVYSSQRSDGRRRGRPVRLRAGSGRRPHQLLGPTRVHAVPRAVAARRGRRSGSGPSPTAATRRPPRPQASRGAAPTRRTDRRGRRLRRPAPGRADQGGPRQPRARGAPADRRSLPRRRTPGRRPVPRHPPRRPPVDAAASSASCRSRSASRSSSTTARKAPTAPTRPARSSSAWVRRASSPANG